MKLAFATLGGFGNCFRSHLGAMSSNGRPFLKNDFNRYSSFSSQVAEKTVDKSLVPVHHLALNHLGRVAIQDNNGPHTYHDIAVKSTLLAKKIGEFYKGGVEQQRIGFMCPNDATYVVAQWACWASGHIGKCLTKTVVILIKFNANF